MGSRVAVIDDEAEFRELLRDILEAEGYEVVSLDGTEPELLSALASYQPHLIVLDLRLGGEAGSGWDLLVEIRRHPELDAAPVLVCSADVRHLRERRGQFSDDPAVRVLEKPFSVDDLEAAVADLVVGQAIPLWDDDADVVLVADHLANFVHASKAALRLLGRSPRELRGMQVVDIVAQGSEWTEREWDRYLRDRRWEGLVTILTRDGRELTARSQAHIVETASGIWHVSRLSLERDGTSLHPA
jgi:PAS domain S-box-containing protein